MCFYQLVDHQPCLVALDGGLDVVVALDDVLRFVEVAHLLEAALVAHVLDDAGRDRRVPAPSKVKPSKGVTSKVQRQRRHVEGPTSKVDATPHPMHARAVHVRRRLGRVDVDF